jgi:FixJ family two-component response regulator
LAALSPLFCRERAKIATTVYILDDDPSVRTALARLLKAAGMHAELFESPDDLFSHEAPPPHACVVADAGLIATSVRCFMDWLKAREWETPVILLSAVDTALDRAMAKRAGAAAFFRKPVDGQALIDTIEFIVNSNHSVSTNT